MSLRLRAAVLLVLATTLLPAQTNPAQVKAAPKSMGTFNHNQDERTGGPPAMASTYVPLDSWTYAAFERLSALGYVQTVFAGMRPWTRLDCARLVQEAAELLPADEEASGEAFGMMAALRREFGPELERLAGGQNRELRLESVYTRVMAITGTPLTDGYHFAQTWTNDFGRPYGEGANVVAGVSSRAVYGRWAFYVRGEYQHSAAQPVTTDAVRQAIAVADHTPVADATRGAVDRGRVLDTYVAAAFGGWQASFGRQSLWWGPGTGGAMIFSNNAEPVTMFRLTQTAPTRLPSLFGWLGPVRTELFFGRLGGQRFVSPDFRTVVAAGPQPYIHGEKLTFKPTPNLEFGFSRTAILGGPGLPLTWRSVARSYFSATNVTGANDPGDRRAGFDFRYRVPGLRNWLVLYNDSLAEDEISPVGYPRQSAMNPGIYLPQLPRARQLDLRVEAAYTDLPAMKYKGGWFYWNDKYLSGYTHRGQLLGGWVGRQGRGVHASSTYWLSAEDRLTVSYRHVAASREFLGGGAQHNVGARAEFAVRPEWRLSTGVQYERWNFPLLSTSAKNNFGAWAQLTFSPAGAWK